MHLQGGHFRNDMRLVSNSPPAEFRVFMRKSVDFVENFSIGLVYRPNDGSGEVTLLRCNGRHGGFDENSDPEHSHWGFHIHRASAEMIEAGLRAEKLAAATREYASYEEALQHLLRVANVTNAADHFPDLMQTRFPFANEEDHT